MRILVLLCGRGVISFALPVVWDGSQQAAMVRAQALTASVSSAAGTTRLTSPTSRAVAASIISPVRSISIAGLRAMARVSATDGVVQNRPTSMPFTPKRERSEAIARSHDATSSAAGGGGDFVDLGNDGPRMLDDRAHQPRAHSESVLEEGSPSVGIAAMRGHLLEIVAAREQLSGSREDNDMDGRVGGGGAEFGLKVISMAAIDSGICRRIVEGQAENGALLLRTHERRELFASAAPIREFIVAPLAPAR